MLTRAKHLSLNAANRLASCLKATHIGCRESLTAPNTCAANSTGISARSNPVYAATRMGCSAAKLHLIVAIILIATGCATTQPGVLKTPDNLPITLSDAKRSALLTPGPITAKVNYTLHKVEFTAEKKILVSLPFINGQEDPAKITQYQKERYSHYGQHQEVFITNLGEPYSSESENTCYTQGDCRKLEQALICEGQIIGEHTQSREYQKRQQDNKCTRISQYYTARGESCEGRATTRVLNQDYSAFDSFDFFNLTSEKAEAYFDSETTRRTKELSRSTGTCFINNPG